MPELFFERKLIPQVPEGEAMVEKTRRLTATWARMVPNQNLVYNVNEFHLLPAKFNMIDPLRDKKILLIDDEPGVLRALSLLLKALGAHPHCIENPESALSYIASESVKEHDVIVSDLRMPDHDGMEMLAGRNQHCSDMPFILISGHATDNEVQQALTQGASGFLAKPFSPDDVRILFTELRI